jgi:hypothetical protein
VRSSLSSRWRLPRAARLWCRVWTLAEQLTIEESGTAGGKELTRIPSDQIVRVESTTPTDAAVPASRRVNPGGPPARDNQPTAELTRRSGLITLELAGGDRLLGTVSALEPTTPVVGDTVSPSEPPTPVGGDAGRRAMPSSASDPADPRSAASDEDMVLVTVSAGPIVVPLERIAVLATSAAESARWRATLDELRGRPSTEDDSLLLTNGDVLHGFLRRIAAAGIAFEQGESQLVVPLERVVAALMAATPPPAVSGLRATILLTDGGRLTASRLDWSGEQANVEIFGGRQQMLPADRIAQVNVAGGRWVWLSSLEPISDQHTPMLDLPWPRVADANVLGEPLRVAGRTFEYGIGVHSASVLRFDLAGNYRTFVTSFGLDDDSGFYADVNVAIHIDGRPGAAGFQQKNVRPGVLHGPVRLDVSGARSLDLIVDFGENGDLQDRFDWVEAALIK